MYYSSLLSLEKFDPPDDRDKYAEFGLVEWEIKRYEVEIQDIYIEFA